MVRSSKVLKRTQLFWVPRNPVDPNSRTEIDPNICTTSSPRSPKGLELLLESKLGDMDNPYLSSYSLKVSNSHSSNFFLVS